MLSKKILLGPALVAAVVAITIVTAAMPLGVEQKTYSHENASLPPAIPLSEYGDKFVTTVEEASDVVGFHINEPKLPKGVEVRFIAIHGDRTVGIFASPNEIRADTTNYEFIWELEGVQIIYEKMPDRLSHVNADDKVNQWAKQHKVTTEKTNGKSQAVKPISVGMGHGGEFDIPAKAMTSKGDILISAQGFYPSDQLASILKSTIMNG